MTLQPELPRDEQSQLLRRRLRDAVAASAQNQQEMGELVFLVQEHAYWRDWGYPDFRSCLKQEFRISLRTAQELISVYRTYGVGLGLPPERLRQLEWSKAALLAPLVTPETTDAILHDLFEQKLSLRQLRKKYKLAKVSAARTVVPATVNADGQLPAADWRRPKPSDDQFYIPQPQWDVLCYALHHQENVLLLGHSGCGKTELCFLLAQAFEKNLERFNCGAMTEARTALIGNTHLDREKGTWFQPSRFVAAITEPRSCILLDELSRAPRDAFNLVLPVLDHQRYLALDESADGNMVHVAAGVNFLATANVGAAYVGADQLDQALLDRFPVILTMDFPPADQEKALLRKRCPGLSDHDAGLLVRFANQQRKLAREEEWFMTMISTRSLLAAGRLVAAGMPLADAIAFSILSRFPAEGGDVSERTKLLQLLQKLIG